MEVKPFEPTAVYIMHLKALEWVEKSASYTSVFTVVLLLSYLLKSVNVMLMPCHCGVYLDICNTVAHTLFAMFLEISVYYLLQFYIKESCTYLEATMVYMMYILLTCTDLIQVSSSNNCYSPSLENSTQKTVYPKQIKFNIN